MDYYSVNEFIPLLSLFHLQYLQHFHTKIGYYRSNYTKRINSPNINRSSKGIH